jgi:AraC-like DNA-binding protein
MHRPEHKVTPHRSKVPGIDAIEFETARAFPRHAHDQYGIGVILAGAQRSWSGRGQVESFAGGVITVNPGEMHDGLPAGDSPRRWRMLYFDPPLLAGARGQREFQAPSLRDRGLANLVLALFAQVTGAGDALAAGESLVRIAAPLMGSTLTGTRKPSRPAPAIAKAKARIDEDPACPVTLAELAALAGTGRFQLVRAFAREVGATPHAYLVQRRVLLARRLLVSGETPASAAAGAGFADQSHMTRAFARAFGVTPARYIAARA